MADHKRAQLNNPWSDLPLEIVSNIGRHLDSGVDLCRLHSVCKNWHSTRNPNRMSLLSPFLPLIISNASLPFTDRGHVPVILVARAVLLVKPLCSSSDSCGWLLTVEEVVPGKLRILYPLSTDRVEHLPSNCPEYLDLSKFIVSQIAISYVFKYESDEEDVPDVIRVVLCSWYTAMVLFGEGTLIGLNLKSGNWSYVRHSLVSSFSDVISYGGNHVRAIDTKGNVHVIDHRVSKVVKSIFLPSVFSGFDHINLLRSNGELFVAACFRKDRSRGFRFVIYRLDEAQSKWIDAGNSRNCSKVLFISSCWSFFLYPCDLDLCNFSPDQRPKLSFGYKESLYGVYVIYSENSFPSLEYCHAIRLYEGASLDLDIGVFFFNREDSHFWKKALYSTTTDVLWPPPTWFWPDTDLSSREDEELDIYSRGDSPYKNNELLPSADASTRVSALNKRALGTMTVGMNVSTAFGSYRALSIQKLDQSHSTVRFEGLTIKSNLVQTLQKVWAKYGNILEGSLIRNADMLTRALESLATALLILETSSGRSLNKTQADYLSSVLCDLQLMNFKVDWLVPFVEKAIAVHKSKPLIDSMKGFGRAKAQAEEMKLKVLDELAKLDEVEEDLILVSDRLPVLESMDFDQSLGDGLY